MHSLHMKRIGRAYDIFIASIFLPLTLASDEHIRVSQAQGEVAVGLSH